jgi:hypothetical protein
MCRGRRMWRCREDKNESRAKAQRRKGPHKSFEPSTVLRLFLPKLDGIQRLPPFPLPLPRCVGVCRSPNPDTVGSGVWGAGEGAVDPLRLPMSARMYEMQY